MPTIKIVTKVSKETDEEYQAWVMNPDESKDYSDFRYVNNNLGKVLEYLDETQKERFHEFLAMMETNADVDIADFIIQELGRE